MKRRTVLTLLLLAAIAVAAVYLVRGILSGTQETVPPQAGPPQAVGHPAQRKPPAVEVIQASKTAVSLDLELSGSVEPYRVAQLASPAEGPVLDIRVREGDRVKAGDALLCIGRKEGIDALIASLREELRKEEDNLRRTRQLVESEALPGEQLDQARAAYERIRAQLVQAEETAQDYTITAPWEGVVSHLLVKEGEYVAPRAALLELYDPSSLVIRAAVPEKHAAEVAADMRVDVRLDAFPDEVLPGRIERVYPYLDSRLRTRSMEIVLDEPAALLPGMFARLKVRLRTVDEAVMVPLEALVATPGGPVVFVVENGKAVRRPVETGLEEGNRVQIISGVQPGEKVIVAGGGQLQDGAAVSVPGQEPSGPGKKPSGTASPAAQKPQAGGDPR